MRIVIDGTDTDLSLDTRDLLEIQGALGKHCNAIGRVVTEFKVNGTEIPLLGPSDSPPPLAAEIQEIEVVSSPVREVATKVIHACGEHVSSLVQAVTAAAQQLRDGEKKEGMLIVEEALTLWVNLSEGTLSALQVLGLDFDSITTVASDGGDNRTATEVLDQINGLLEETQRAFEDDDIVEISDILDYDLPPLLMKHQQILYLLAEEGAKRLN